ncbi:MULTISPECIES: hypothetical protein [unclassified Rhizobium]
MRESLALGAVLTATLMLAGCMSGSSGVRTDYSNVSVTVGKRTRVDAAYAIKKDCSLRMLPALHLIEPPKHGSFEVVHEKVVPSSVKKRTRTFVECNEIPVDGTVGYYQPTPGFLGADKVVTSHSYADGGLVLHKVITISVIR